MYNKNKERKITKKEVKRLIVSNLNRIERIRGKNNNFSDEDIIKMKYPKILKDKDGNKIRLKSFKPEIWREM